MRQSRGQRSGLGIWWAPATVSLVAGVLCPQAAGQLTDEDLRALKQQASAENWTFTVGPNGATDRSLDQLCGFRVPEGWQHNATFDPCTPRDLPPAFDWRDLDGCTAIRNQGTCGSCWAFGTVGALECAIKIYDGLETDLSEQWLVSCNQDGWGGDGGFVAHDYHMWKDDPCGGTGAVFDADFGYAGSELPCDCPYPHQYLLESWAFIGAPYGVPEVDAIKQAILDYGPVSVGVYVNDAFQAYTGDVFNGCENDMETNHCVVLVGWDDNQGTEGVWILRNSWGAGWGEGGYMRIEYGCSSVGEAAAYVNYGGYDALDVLPHYGMLSTGEVGGPFTPVCKQYTLTNEDAAPVSWTANAAAEWITVFPSEGTVDAGSTADVQVCLKQDATGLGGGPHEDAITFTNTSTDYTRTRPVELWVGSLFDVPVDSGASTVTAELCVQGNCDTDSSNVAGYHSIQLDDVETPGTISFFDFDLSLTSDLQLDLSWSIFGAFHCTLQDLTLRPVEPGNPAGPEPVTSDSFAIQDFGQQMDGTLVYTATGIPCALLQDAGLPCSDTVDLNGARAYAEQVGTVTSAARTVTLTMDVDQVFVVEELAEFELVGTVTGDAFVPVLTYGDYDQDGSVDLRDYASWSACSTGPQMAGPPVYDAGCQWFDFDFDYDVDLADFAAFQRQ